jgi:hypothetical protein
MKQANLKKFPGNFSPAELRPNLFGVD